MKLFRITALALIVESSHFRGGTYQITQNDDDVRISFTQTWRRGKAGYGSIGCTQNDVTNGKMSDIVGSWKLKDAVTDDIWEKGDVQYQVCLQYTLNTVQTRFRLNI